jgi:hypothetical protein
MSFKTLIIAAALLASAAAGAGTITLAPVGCGLTRSCAPATDTGDVVQFNAAYGNYVRLTLNGVLYSSPGFQKLANFDSYQLQAADGTLVFLTATFTTFRQCNVSGHNVCSTRWYLTSGQVVTP